jgi:hypothetical protein
MPGNRRRPSRRSFLARVLGAGTAYGATALVSGAHAQHVRTWSATEAACASGLTDSDSGRNADPAGNGRGTGGVTDSDTGTEADPVGQGRGTGGVTDTDSGSEADPVGQGRGSKSAHGITDSDSGASADPAGQGRGGRRMTDTDIGWGADRVGHGRGGEGRERPVPPVNCPPREDTTGSGGEE